MKGRIPNVKTAFLCFLSIAQFFSTSFVSAAPQPATFNMSSAQIARVEEEVLTGEISNDAEVLALAIAEATGARVVDASVPAVHTDERLCITQVLSVSASESGTIEKEVAYSTLVVVDENGNEIQRDRVTSGSLNSSGKVPNYEIYAVSTT